MIYKDFRHVCWFTGLYSPKIAYIAPSWFEIFPWAYIYIYLIVWSCRIVTSGKAMKHIYWRGYYGDTERSIWLGVVGVVMTYSANPQLGYGAPITIVNWSPLLTGTAPPSMSLSASLQMMGYPMVPPNPHPPVIKHGNGKYTIGDFSIETPISSGFPIATFDYRRVSCLSSFFFF